jgi:glycosyltransferase involved in cell wall biosynthesis
MTFIVSVCMITYNHEKYISDAIEGVLMQKTEFPIQLIIGEDCSTDRTRTICEEYACEYPDKIKLLPSERNYGMMSNFLRTISASNGEYIAICEGDDYWLDDKKLQKQYDYMQHDGRCVMVYHDVYKRKYDEDDFNYINKGVVNEIVKININDLIKDTYVPSLSAFIRRDICDKISKDYLLRSSGSYFLFFALCKYGYMVKMSEKMGVYRIHKEGMWNSKDIVGKSKLALFNILLIAEYYKEDEEIYEKIIIKYLYEVARYSVSMFKCKKFNNIIEINIVAIKKYGINRLAGSYVELIKRKYGKK